MRYELLFFLVLLSGITHAQSCKKMYKEQLEPNSKLISCEYNSTIEKLKDGTVIFKRYYPVNKTITHRVTFKSDNFKVRHGLFEERWDDGMLVTSGMYRNNQKHGQWRSNTKQIGVYKDDLKEGIWLSYRADTTVYAKQRFVNGKLHGDQLFYDTTGALTHTEIFENGIMTLTTNDTIRTHPEQMPRFSGCETMELPNDERKICADKKMMNYIYSRLKYPMKARENGIQGKALVQFVIDKNGAVTDIRVLNGVSKEIKKEVTRLVNKMPVWIPGRNNGQPVNVQYNLPIMFRLE